MKRTIIFRLLGVLLMFGAFTFYTIIKWPLRQHGSVLQWVISLSIFFALVGLAGQLISRE